MATNLRLAPYRPLLVCLVCLLIAVAPHCQAQDSPALPISASTPIQNSSPAAQPVPGSGPTYRLKTSSRIVLTDVTVTGRNGEHIAGIPSSAFVLTDEDKPQKLSSFTEHTPALAGPVAEHAADHPLAFSNAFVLHPPPVLNVVLIDINNLDVQAQLYLNFQLTQLLKKLPAGEPLALYWCRGLNVVLLQGFTADHASLLAALGKALPRFPSPDREFYSSANVLHQMAVSLAQLPGRKNVLWFSGGTTTSFSPFGGDSAGVSAAEDTALHVVYNELESGRIAVYPFDAQGLTTDISFGRFAQQGLLRQVAENTGGHAFVNTNALQAEASSLLAADGAYYTLTYSPQNFKPDGRWHRVHVSLLPPYGALHLSFRRGYFADDAAPPAPAPGTRLAAGVPTATPLGTLPDGRTPPIIFDVEAIAATAPGPGFTPARLTLVLSPAQHRRGARLYVLRYRVPLAAFAIQTAAPASAGEPAVTPALAVLAFNSYGSIAARRAEKITVHLNPAALPVRQGDTLTVDQQIDLPTGDTSVFCAVWDAATQRLGTVQFPIVVPK